MAVAGYVEQDEATKPKTETEIPFETRWYVPPEDVENFSKSEGFWVTASSCDGFVFLWPLDRPVEPIPSRFPRTPQTPEDEGWEEGMEYPGTVRCAYVHPYVCTDYCFDFERMTSISCGGDCRVVYYDFETSKAVATVKNNSGIDISQAYICCDGDSDCGKVAIGTCSGQVKIGDLENGKVMMQMRGHTEDCYDVKADWDRNLVTSAAWDWTIRMWDLRTGKACRTLEGHKSVVNRLDVCYEHMMCASFPAEEHIYFWDLKDGRLVKKIWGHDRGNNDGVVNWEKGEMVTGGEDGMVKVWNIATDECVNTFDCDHLQTLSVDCNWEKGIILTGSWDNKVKTFDLRTGKKMHSCLKARRVITQVAMQGGRKSSRLKCHQK